MSNQNVQTILTTVEKTLIDHGFLPKGTGLLLGLSGGADSVMLLVVLSRLAEKYHFLLEAVHVNHMIRGNEATRDEDFCRSLCLKLKVRLHIITENVPKLALQKGTGLEETARDVRYQAFRRILDNNERLEYVVTAHNAGDNIETVLFHIARGCGLRGICGIPVKRGRVLRPLLSVSKADIIKALEEDGIRFMDDSTNADTRYTRNYIRRDILPAMRKINPGLDGAVFSMCEHLRDDLDFVEQTAKDWISQHNVTTKANASDLAALHVAVVRRIIPLMYQAAGGTQMLEEVHIEPLIAMISHGHTTFIQRFPGGICAYAEGGRIVFSDSTPKAPQELPSQPIKLGVNILNDRDAILVLTSNPDYLKDKGTNVYKIAIKANLSSAKIEGELYVRSRTEGDSYRYGGMTHKIKKLFSDRRLHGIPRHQIPVLCDEKGVLWVPGFASREDKGKSENQSLYVYYCYRGGQNE